MAPNPGKTFSFNSAPLACMPIPAGPISGDPDITGFPDFNRLPIAWKIASLFILITCFPDKTGPDPGTPKPRHYYPYFQVKGIHPYMIRSRSLRSLLGLQAPGQG
jgi:hypothetical protein